MTAGVVIATLVSTSGGGGGGVISGKAGKVSRGSKTVAFELVLGATLCALSTLAMALLGVAQERAFARYGQHHAEAICMHARAQTRLLLE